ncbi:MAG: DNA cytosine methyltransferase [Steroidobacteraceae bacterium]|nr:DNA cytosine methyltransferase [Steroidobacteraceae bacterium]
MPTTISLFTGAGGLDLGLHTAGFEARIAIECDRIAVETLRHPKNAKWWEDCAIVDKPIEALTSKEILKKARLRKCEADLLVGGPPCQPFSKSGYWHTGDARRLQDPRAQTLREYLRVLEETLPKVFLLENVPGLAFSQKDEGLEYLRRSLEEVNRRSGANYQISAAQLNAVEYGVPQLRERVIVIGHREGKTFKFPAPTHMKPPHVDMANGSAELPGLPFDFVLQPFTTAWDALAEFIRQDDEELKPRGKWADLLPTIPEGHNYLYHTNRGGGAQIFGWRRRYWSMLLKLAKNRPSWTLTAQPGPAIGPFHWENRRLSAAELCALQTFPRGYHIVGNVMQAHKQVGNAVPSALAEVLGLEIRRQLLGERRVPRKVTLIPAKRDDMPPPEPVAPLPEKYFDLVDDHADHPGEGKGPGAMRRARREAGDAAFQ